MDNLKNSILEADFDLAKKILKNMKNTEIEKMLSIFAYDLDNIAVYFLILEIISEEENAFWHSVASTILSTAFCYIPGAYQIAFRHMRKAVMLDPLDISYKQGILLFYSIPERILESEEAYKIAKEILEYDNTDATAQGIINRINNEEK